MNEANKKPVKPYPLILNVGDAIEHAARQLRSMADEHRLIALVANIVKDKPELRESMPAEIRNAIIDPEKTQAALAAGAAELEALVTEHRVLAARAGDKVAP